MAASYLIRTSKSTGAAAQLRKMDKRSKHQRVAGIYQLCPFGVETMVPFGKEAFGLVTELGGRLRAATGEPHSQYFLV
jgi:hypothetical protein